MWKKILSIIPWIVLAGLLGYYLSQRFGRNTIIKPDESVIDSLECLKASYESITDSLFLLKTENDSLTKAKIREVTKYRFVESVRYIEKETGLDSIQTAVVDSDSVALLKNQELQVISGKLAELDGLQEQVKIDSAIIEEQALTIAVADTIIEMKDQVIEYKEQEIKEEKKKRKKTFWKALGIGAGSGATITSLIFLLSK